MRKHINPLWIAILFASLSASFTFATTYTWTNFAGGNWSQGINWSPIGPPTASDTALITNNGTYTVTVNSADAANVLTLGGPAGTQTLLISSGGSLSLGSASTGSAQGVLNITGGTLGGAGSLVLAGPMNWGGGTITNSVQFNGGAFSNTLFLNAGQAINTGTLNWTAAAIDVGNGSIISNAPTGTINLTAALGEGTFGGARTFNNAGQLNVTVSGTATISDVFNNSGSVAVNGGTLTMNGGGAGSGSFTAASGATLDFAGGTFSISNGSTLSGAGNFTVAGATITIPVGLNMSGTWTFSGGATTLTGATTVSGNAVIVSGAGTVNFNGAGPWHPGTLTISGGTLGGTNPVIVQNVGGMSWSGGTIATNLVQFNGGTFSGAFFLNNGAEVINTGTLSWTAATIDDGNGSIISNAPTGTINMTGNLSEGSFGGTKTFNNAGQLNVSVSGTATISDVFNNSGSVAVNGGILDLSGGGTGSGSFTAASGATLDFGASTYTISNSSTLSGAGNFMVSGATITIPVALNLGGTWTFSGGTTTLTGATTVSGNAVIISGSGATVIFNGTGPWQPGTLTFSSGALGGATPVTVQNPNGMAWGGGTIYTNVVQFNGGAFSNILSLNGGKLINKGTLNWTATPIDTGNGSIISNAPTGTINLTAILNEGSVGGTSSFLNAGQLNVSVSGTATIPDSFTNTGTITLNGGTLDLSGAHSLAGGNLVFGINALNNYGSNTLASAAGLAGTLKSAFNGAYLPSVGNTYNIMTYGSSSGSFATTNLSPLAVWTVSQGATALSITVVKLVPQLSLPANVIHGTAVGSPRLSATAIWNGTNVPGAFTYTPAAGTVLNAGSNQMITVSFVPTDTSTFASVTTNFLVNVLPPPRLTITANSSHYALTFQAIPGQTYQLQTTTNLTTAWTALGTAIVDTNGTVNVTNNITGPRAFFRLQIQLSP